VLTRFSKTLEFPLALATQHFRRRTPAGNHVETASPYVGLSDRMESIIPGSLTGRAGARRSRFFASRRSALSLTQTFLALRRSRLAGTLDRKMSGDLKEIMALIERACCQSILQRTRLLDVTHDPVVVRIPDANNHVGTLKKACCVEGRAAAAMTTVGGMECLSHEILPKSCFATVRQKKVRLGWFDDRLVRRRLCSSSCSSPLCATLSTRGRRNRCRRVNPPWW